MKKTNLQENTLLKEYTIKIGSEKYLLKIMSMSLILLLTGITVTNIIIFNFNFWISSFYIILFCILGYFFTEMHKKITKKL